MVTARDIWLLSALAVLAITTLAYTLSNLAALVGGRNRSATARRSRPSTDPAGSLRIERTVYRHHRLFGAIIVAVSAIYLYRTMGRGLIWLDPDGSVWQTGLMALTFFQMLLIPFGIVVFFRPSLLRRAEQIGNRWIDWQHGRAGRAVRVVLGGYCLAALVALVIERVR